MGLGELKHVVDVGNKYVLTTMAEFLDHIEGSESVALSFEVWDLICSNTSVHQMIDPHGGRSFLSMVNRTKDVLAGRNVGSLTGCFGNINGTYLFVDYEYPDERPTEDLCYYVLRKS